MSDVVRYRVYLVTNLTNGKQYAGQTCRSAKDRWKRHVLDADKERGFALHGAIRKYGKESFAVSWGQKRRDRAIIQAGANAAENRKNSGSSGLHR